MKMKMLAAFAAASVFAVQAFAVSADWGYDEGWGYTEDYGYSDYGYTDYNDYGYSDDYTYYYGYDDTDYSGDNYNADAGDYSGDNTLDDSSRNPDENNPATITLEPTKIDDYKFSAKLKVKSKTPVAAADLTITYNPEILKLTGNTINEKAEGSAVAAETEKGIFQYQFTNAAGSEWEEEYITLDFEIVDPLERSTVLYISVNSLLNTSNHEITCVANGTVIQIEGAVTVDASMDESRFTELRISKTSLALSYESLGLKDVKNVTFEDGEIAAASDKGVLTLSQGITNMTVEFNDGTFKYYRLVISEPAVTVQGEDNAPVEVQTVVIDGKVTEIQQTIPQAAPQSGVTKTETKSNKKVKYFVIYIVVLAAIIALFIEGFVILGNPYSKTAAILKAKKNQKAAGTADEDGEEYEEEEYEEDSEYEDGEYEEDAEYEDAEYEEGEYEEAEYEESEEEYEDAEYDAEETSAEEPSEDDEEVTE